MILCYHHTFYNVNHIQRSWSLYGTLMYFKEYHGFTCVKTIPWYFWVIELNYYTYKMYVTTVFWTSTMVALYKTMVHSI